MTSRLALAIALILTCHPWVRGDTLPPRYDLRAGDHLVYREQLERRVTTPQAESLIRLEWTSHGLVTEAGADGFAMGFQRNRIAGSLVRYQEKGRDRLDRERPAFEDRLARQPRAFAEANRFRVSGAAVLPWSALREARSEALPYFHEIEPLPLRALQPGESWSRPGDLPAAVRTTGEERVGEGDCLRFEAATAERALRVRYWFCPAVGALGRIEVEADYHAPPDRTVHETLVFDRIEKRQGEGIAGWLADPDLRQGALAALGISETVPVPVEALYGVLGTGDEAAERGVLSLLYRRRQVPPLERLAPFLGGPSAALQRLARRLTQDSPSSASGATPLAALARAIRGTGPLPAWSCGEAGAWSEAALGARLFPAELPGTTLRRLRTGPFAGLPYIIHVPDHYRGDQPLPLIVDLSGGPGLAITGALADQEALGGSGHLVVYPQAVGFWWDDRSVQAFDALWRELLAGFDIDLNHVFLTGFSNGGTGALLWATLWPDRFAAVAPLMGAGLPFFEANPPAVENLGRLPMLFLHGDQDPIIPSRASRETVKAIQKRSPTTPVTLQVLPDRGHDLILGRDGTRVLEFLSRQARNPFPRRVTFRTRSLDFARSFWVEILDKKDGWAEVEAQIGEDGTIEVKTRGVRRLRLLLRRELAAPSVRVVLNGRPAGSTPLGEDCALLLRSWRATGDPYLAHSGEMLLDAEP